MSQSTPTAVTKRKVMGRMDAAPAESPSNSVTPNARPRIVRAQHGYSSPSFSNNITPTANRPAPGAGRARVDMSAFASPSSTASSPAMSPSVSGRPVSASSSGPSSITARMSAPSPTIRSTPMFHTRSGSTVAASASSYRLTEARLEGPMDPNLASLRSPTVRARNGSIDLGRNSPSVASPSVRVSGNSHLSSSASIRSPVPRADQSPFPKPSTPSTSVRSAASLPTRGLLSPQRSQESLDRAVNVSQDRSPSPKLPPASPSLAGQSYFPPTQPPKPLPYARNSEPIVPGRQTSIPITATSAVRNVELTGRHDSTSGNDASLQTQTFDAVLPRKSDPLTSATSAAPVEPGSAMTTGRALFRPESASQRATMPPSFMDLAVAAAPVRPDAEHRASFASSSYSANSASLPLSPSFETPRSPSEAGEAEEARVHRKLLDLEITNKSLLAINSALEVTKLKQAREIRELKRRLRDGRGLPVAAVSRSSAGSATLSDEDDLTDSDDDDDDDLPVKEDPELEAAHQRCKLLVDSMVEQARKAILAEYDEPGNTRGKVLHPVELEELQRELDEDGDNTEADTTVATDLMESSMTMDSSVGDISKHEQFPFSSSNFSENSVTDSSTASASLQSIESILSRGPDSITTPRIRSHSTLASNAYSPPGGDVSID